MSFPNTKSYPPGWNDPPSNVDVLSGRKCKHENSMQPSPEVVDVARMEQILKSIIHEYKDNVKNVYLTAHLECYCSVEWRWNVVENVGRLWEETTAADWNIKWQKYIKFRETWNIGIHSRRNILYACFCTYWMIMIIAFEARDYVQSTKAVTKLMTSSFSSDSNSNPWILGLKRLNDLLKKI